jgi:hypothetical protein
LSTAARELPAKNKISPFRFSPFFRKFFSKPIDKSLFLYYTINTLLKHNPNKEVSYGKFRTEEFTGNQDGSQSQSGVCGRIAGSQQVHVFCKQSEEGRLCTNRGDF